MPNKHFNYTDYGYKVIVREFDPFGFVISNPDYDVIHSNLFKGTDLITEPGKYHKTDFKACEKMLHEDLAYGSAEERLLAQKILLGNNSILLTPRSEYTYLILDLILRHFKSAPECLNLIQDIQFPKPYGENHIRIQAAHGKVAAELLLQHIIIALQGIDRGKVAVHYPSAVIDITGSIDDLVRYTAEWLIEPKPKLNPASGTIATASTKLSVAAGMPAVLRPFETIYESITARDFKTQLLLNWVTTALNLIYEIESMHARNLIYTEINQVDFIQNVDGTYTTVAPERMLRVSVSQTEAYGYQSVYNSENLHSLDRLRLEQSILVDPDAGFKEGHLQAFRRDALKVYGHKAGLYTVRPIYSKATNVEDLGRLLSTTFDSAISTLRLYPVHDSSIYKLAATLETELLNPMRYRKERRPTLEQCKAILLQFKNKLLALVEVADYRLKASEQVFLAIINDDLTKVQQLLQQDPQLLYFNDDRGLTILDIATSLKRTVIQQLIEQKMVIIPPLQQRPNRLELLCAAATAGDLISLDVLLQSGEPLDLNARNDQHQSALRLAITNGHTEFVKKMLAAGADPCELFYDTFTCKHNFIDLSYEAYRNWNYESISSLRNIFMQCVAVNRCDLLQRIASDYPEVLHLLINHTDIMCGRTAVTHAIENDSVAAFKLLLKLGAAVVVQNYQIRSALEKDRLDIVFLIYNCGQLKDINIELYNDFYAKCVAAKRNDLLDKIHHSQLGRNATVLNTTAAFATHTAPSTTQYQQAQAENEEVRHEPSIFQIGECILM